jgi:hypothetical protein
MAFFSTNEASKLLLLIILNRSHVRLLSIRALSCQVARLLATVADDSSKRSCFVILLSLGGD